jgi:hypothetical protein
MLTFARKPTPHFKLRKHRIGPAPWTMRLKYRQSAEKAGATASVYSGLPFFEGATFDAFR